jgi:glyoxylase-like metal-dependent hydrolase (beta-lactamase superfamily II)
VTKIIEPSPGIWLITLPLPFELKHVNVGLVRVEGGYLLIDTGLTFGPLSKALGELGIEWPEVKTVVATHIHPDHIACAPKIVEASGAKLAMHRAEFDYFKQILAGDPYWMEAAFVEGGVPRESWDLIRNAVGSMREMLSAVHPDRFLEHGDTLATALGTAVVVATPGHSAGHICLHWPHRRLLYSGDHLIETITPNIAWMPGRDMLGEYLDSLDRVGALEVDLVIASHGKPFGRHREWVAATQRHHEERCDAILRGLAAEPRTAFDLIPAVWERDFSPFHVYFALFEVLAHLEYMLRRGRVRFDGGATRRWLPADGAAVTYT